LTDDVDDPQPDRHAGKIAIRSEFLGSLIRRTSIGADRSHLTRAFVRQFGVTPGRYVAARA
jgi:hypothetical protein